jgi:spore coat protein CotF
MQKLQKQEMMLNEKDSLQDMLNIEKQMVKLYGTAVTESSNKNLRKMLKQNFSEITEDQFNVYQQMVNANYYQTKPADKATIDEKFDNFNKIKNQLSQQ